MSFKYPQQGFVGDLIESHRPLLTAGNQQLPVVPEVATRGAIFEAGKAFDHLIVVWAEHLYLKKGRVRIVDKIILTVFSRINTKDICQWTMVYKLECKVREGGGATKR